MTEMMSYMDNGTPVLKKSYCVFMDVLGFSNLISTSSGQHNENEVFLQFYETSTKILRVINKLSNDGFSMKVKIFSDNILLAAPWYTDEGENEFGLIVEAIQEYQLRMALHGFFIRGGLSIGKLFIDDSMIYGKALLDAYDLESKIASDPKVVISDEAFNIFKKHTRYYAHPEHAPQNSDIVVDADKRGFINYLQALILEDHDGQVIDTANLILHKEKILEALNCNSENIKVWYKYHWLCDYHNYFCDCVNDIKGITPACKIQESEYKRTLGPFVEPEQH
ncbi:hypothetical protein HMPREF1170_02661 [Aeromonas veronii AMC35]|uniref:hypothetical protein n=1 Tax=Aeromonas veronii TaxID=654 RepID=UPI0002806D09|nr:hypothetical protein [Aeromonas veronii]EKB22399.1 hypothetical protein HMPREF1170_02661 [Aeromonas veronii AMC35]TNJ03922.1 hypothetical protein CF117_10030 [Aeromonas veronii]